MKTAIVTGASGGIGGAIAAKLAEDGWQVAAVYNTGKDRAQRLRQSNPAIKTYQCDISDYDSVERLFSTVQADFGSVDGLVNCAGTAYSGLLQDMGREDIDRVVARDLTGTLYCCKFAAGEMVKKHRGVILNISSVWGLYGASCEAVYSACKGGVVTFTKALAKELGPAGIRVNCISPGVIKTKMLDCYTRRDLQALADETPLGTLGTPEDVALAARFLMSENSRFITGHNLSVDGGFAL